MNEYTILLQQNPKPADVPEFHQCGFLFNDYNHLRQQDEGYLYLLTALNKTTRRADARCAFFIRSNEAVSPQAAPFGSIEFSKTLPEPVLVNFLDLLVETARTVDVASLRIVNYPNCYAPEQASLLTTHLINHGFRIRETSQTFFLPITANPFEQTITPAERRRLHKCREAGFQFMHWKTPDISKVIEFLQGTRYQKGYPLTIAPEKLTNLLRGFPNHVSVFTVNDGVKPIALTVAVRVREDIVYNFLPASHPAYHTFSPMVMLIGELFAYCQKQKIKLLDLGVSLDDNHQPKPSLIRFKRNLGAQESPKLVFEKLF
ncbi:GNAT family N-acetyltransferase [Spirosoma sp. KCTC 42546]|uniref:GNAT family N-acetyltransferase n=1 Tax=Spirosoma sp. KCTC 42546 TaxID=2520506 RepID=UPI001158E60B|nr:GNAT family N-acetyltransferase [Spirosoma sp. KCTC 42546]QDK81843.1 GNAT family N-acetyltransferase [Spirosoma sp. KCTC 42546]